MNDDDLSPFRARRVVLVTGPSGAGRGTTIRVLEDLGYEAIDNLPLSLIPRLLEGPPMERPMALGIDVRNRDFSADAMLGTLDTLRATDGVAPELLYLDCSVPMLLRRFSETRRRHPFAPEDAPEVGIEREIDILAPVRRRADVLIDTSELSPHELRDELMQWFRLEGGHGLALSVQSFSFKRGVPRGADMVFDVRFLRNPHWVPELRPLDGRDVAIVDHIAEDPRFQPFFEKVSDLTRFLLPAYKDEGKSHLSIAFGCTGGKHRSVALAEMLGKTLAEDGWRVSIRHRELERRADAGAVAQLG